MVEVVRLPQLFGQIRLWDRDHLARPARRVSDPPDPVRLCVHSRLGHVVDASGLSERRRQGLAILGRGRPEDAAIGLRGEAAIEKVAAKKAELPELVGDVFADVGDDAVRSDDDFFALLTVVDFFGLD